MTLLPDRLQELWEEVKTGHLSQEDFTREQEQLLAVHTAKWCKALLTDEETDLRSSLLREIAAYYNIPDVADVEHLCSNAVMTLQREWDEKVDPNRRASIEDCYESPATVYEEWHSLREDTGPLSCRRTRYP